MPSESFRGALLREPGIHNPDWELVRRESEDMDSGLAGKSPRPGMTDKSVRAGHSLNAAPRERRRATADWGDELSYDLLLNAVTAGLLLGGFYAAVTVGIS